MSGLAKRLEFVGLIKKRIKKTGVYASNKRHEGTAEDTQKQTAAVVPTPGGEQGAAVQTIPYEHFTTVLAEQAPQNEYEQQNVAATVGAAHREEHQPAKGAEEIAQDAYLKF